MHSDYFLKLTQQKFKVKITAYTAHTRLLEKVTEMPFALDLFHQFYSQASQSTWYEEVTIQPYGVFQKKKDIVLLTFVRVLGYLGEDSHFEPQI